ncbi:hypothetical protein I316_02954 [Kwoniella heveanensis BCC8398]|uniref:Uncharacterized protein n=1 Tax=Kwoniella heveanensis BCC8398 TaxID=1296120 RepID=A0A1B9GWJ2_9TREE|nr:hypothetical protein I316_02954 [Kwoniella heveanensis BCC8398]
MAAECTPTPISTLYSTSTSFIGSVITSSTPIVLPAEPSLSTILETICPTSTPASVVEPIPSVSMSSTPTPLDPTATSFETLPDDPATTSASSSSSVVAAEAPSPLSSSSTITPESPAAITPVSIPSTTIGEPQASSLPSSADSSMDGGTSSSETALVDTSARSSGDTTFPADSQDSTSFSSSVSSTSASDDTVVASEEDVSTSTSSEGVDVEQALQVSDHDRGASIFEATIATITRTMFYPRHTPRLAHRAMPSGRSQDERRRMEMEARQVEEECSTITSISTVQGGVMESTSWSTVFVTQSIPTIILVPTETIFNECTETTAGVVPTTSSDTSLPTTTSSQTISPSFVNTAIIFMSSIEPDTTDLASSTSSAGWSSETGPLAESADPTDQAVSQPATTSPAWDDQSDSTDTADVAAAPTQSASDDEDPASHSSATDMASSTTRVKIPGSGGKASAEHQASLTYKPYSTSPPEATESQPTTNKALSAGAAIGGFFALVAVIAAVLFIVRWWKRREREEKTLLLRSSWFYGGNIDDDGNEKGPAIPPHHRHNNPSPQPSNSGPISRFSAPSLLSRRSLFLPKLLPKRLTQTRANSISGKSARSGKNPYHDPPPPMPDLSTIPVMLHIQGPGVNAQSAQNDEQQSRGFAPFKALPTFAGISQAIKSISLPFGGAESGPRKISDPVPLPLPYEGSLDSDTSRGRARRREKEAAGDHSLLLPIFSAFRSIRQSFMPSRRSSTADLRYTRQSAVRGSPAWAEKYPNAAPFIVGEAWNAGEKPTAAMMQPPANTTAPPPTIGYSAAMLGMNSEGPYPLASALSPPLGSAGMTNQLSEFPFFQQTQAQSQPQSHSPSQQPNEVLAQEQPRRSLVQLRHMTWGSSYAAPPSGVPLSAEAGGPNADIGLGLGGPGARRYSGGVGPGMFMNLTAPSDGTNSIYSRTSMSHSQPMCRSPTGTGTAESVGAGAGAGTTAGMAGSTGMYQPQQHQLDGSDFPLPPINMNFALPSSSPTMSSSQSHSQGHGYGYAYNFSTSHTPSPTPYAMQPHGGTFPRSILSPLSAGSNGSRGSLQPPPPIREVGGQIIRSPIEGKRVTRSTTRSSGTWEYTAYVDPASISGGSVRSGNGGTSTATTTPNKRGSNSSIPRVAVPAYHPEIGEASGSSEGCHGSGSSSGGVGSGTPSFSEQVGAEADRVTKNWYDKPLWDSGAVAGSSPAPGSQNSMYGAPPAPKTHSNSHLGSHYQDRSSMQTTTTAGGGGVGGGRVISGSSMGGGNRKSMKSVKSVRWEDSPISLGGAGAEIGRGY